MKLRPTFVIFIASLGLALVFNYFFYAKSLGLSFPLYIILLLIVLIVFFKYFAIRLNKSTLLLATALLFFSLMVFVRASAFLTFLNVAASLYLLLLIANETLGKKLLHNSIPDYFKLILLLLINFFFSGLKALGDLIGSLKMIKEKKVLSQVIKGVLLALPLIFIFLLLFSSADLVFRRYLLGWISIDILIKFLPYIPRIIIVILVTFILVGVLAHLFLKLNHQTRADERSARNSKIGLIEVSILLGSINLLFFIFIIIQLAYLFGGASNISLQGFTYAEYARRGFFELSAVGLISFLVIWLAEKSVSRQEGGQGFLFKIFTSALIMQVILLMVSAFKRLMLYEEAFGWTTSRLFAHVFMIWLVIVFLFLAYKILTTESESVFAFQAFLTALIFLVIMNLMNPDLFIARENIKRYNATGKLDAIYLSQLSSDAIDEIIKVLDLELENQKMKDMIGNELYGRWKSLSESPFYNKWPSTHLARRRAREVLDSRKEELERLFESWQTRFGFFQGVSLPVEVVCPSCEVTAPEVND